MRGVSGPMATSSTEIPVPRDDSLHLRPMQVLVEKAGVFQAKLTLTRGGKLADAKSILDIMMLAAESGPLMLEADGPDAAKATKILAALLKKELGRK